MDICFVLLRAIMGFLVYFGTVLVLGEVLRKLIR
jgi:hypothetical protein